MSSPGKAPAFPGPDGRRAGHFHRPILALLVGNLALAFGPWFVRLADVGPIASGFWRVALALPFLAILAARDRGHRGPAPRAALLIVAAGGMFFALDLGAWHAGILRTRIANAVLFGNVASFFFTAYGFVIARAMPSARQAVAILSALVGVLLLLGRSLELSPEHLRGDLLCLAAGLCYTGYLIAVERVGGALGAWRTLAFATAASAATLLPLALAIEGTVWPAHWGPLAALAIGSQVIGQGLLVYAIGTLPATLVGLGLLLQPIVGAAIGWLVYGERLTGPDLIGAAAIAAALVLIRRR